MQVREIVNGLYEFEITWPQGLGIEVVLTLTDPDGETETDTIEWEADQDYQLRDALLAIIATIDDLVHWRALVVGPGRVAIGPASDDYAGSIDVTLIP